MCFNCSNLECKNRTDSCTIPGSPEITLKFKFVKEEFEKCFEKESSENEKNVKESKEDTTMANNIFNTNITMGMNNDANIASTALGIAVKAEDGSWRIYDKEKKEITNLKYKCMGWQMV